MPRLFSILLVDDAANRILKSLLVPYSSSTDQVLVAEEGQEALHLLRKTCSYIAAQP
jgi:ribulose 1,5-bisphosphate synthetase/thiazole synthase